MLHYEIIFSYALSYASNFLFHLKVLLYWHIFLIFLFILSLTAGDNLLLSIFVISSSAPSGQFFFNISKVLHGCYCLDMRQGVPPKVPVLKGATHCSRDLNWGFWEEI